MPRRLAILLSLLLALCCASAGLAVASQVQEPSVVDVPQALAKQIRKAKRHKAPAVRLPQTLTTDVDPLYASGGSDKRGWAFSLSAVRDCGGATACFVASFSGERGGKPFGRRRVGLHGGIRGYFTPTSCGASCAVPQIQWRQRKVLYVIQARVGTQKTERRELIAMANSAIDAGPR